VKSIVQDKKECWFCYTQRGLHVHHVFSGTANRKKSEQHGMKVFLCGTHHNLSNDSVHFNRTMDLMVKKKAQKVFEEKVGTRDYFIQEFGRSYL
jgi:hypothetical protein